MHDGQSPLFDFSRHAAGLAETVELIRDFAGHDAFRSAAVEELELDDDFHRRPLRPEDLGFIDFSRPITAATATQLPSLASHRLLLAINELDIARAPRTADAAEIARVAAFYSDENRIMAARIRPFLEAFAFDHVAGKAILARPAELVAQLQDHTQAEAASWGGLFARLLRTDYLNEGLRFILLQKWSLAGTRRAALGRAAASGYLDGIAPTDRPVLAPDQPADDLLRRLAATCGVTRAEHSYWQFYLSSTLAGCNLLHALANRPDRALQFCGAAFAAEAEWLALGCLTGQAAGRLGIAPAVRRNDSVEKAISNLADRFGRALETVAERHGPAGVAAVGQGLTAGQKLAAEARHDLAEQLRWLTAVEGYRGIAQRIDARIRAECPDIDRETFIEPREMCSTTHVHDDHRLVVIETGQMVFWGNLGMKLELEPGEMVLVPMGRLHGSSVLSDECIYHQPIIPDEWVDTLVREHEAGLNAA